MKGPRTLALYGDETGCTLWRVYSPYTELQRQGYGAWFRHKDDPETYAPEFPYLAATRLDAVVLPRLSWNEHTISRRWINSLHRAGLTVIYEVDDDVFTPQITARQRATTEPGKTEEQLEQDRRDRSAAIRLCDGVTVSNPDLARVVQRYVDAPVFVVPNSIDVRWWRGVLRGVRRVVPPLTIGWAGGARYADDLEPLAEAWHNIAARYTDVTFVVQGYLADVLVRAVPEGRCRRLSWLPLDQYPRALLNIDIGCAIVADNHFNRCKTPIKVWEYTLAGAAVVASPTLYGDYISDGYDGLIATTAKDWEDLLGWMIENPSGRRHLWKNQRRRIAEHHSLEKNAHLWPEAWQKIIDHARPKLMAA